MNEVKNLLKQLAKRTELKSEKVELALIDDIKQDASNAQKIHTDFKQIYNQSEYQGRQAENLKDEYNNFVKALNNSRKRAEDKVRELKGIVSSMQGAFSKAEKAYKELGEKTPSELSKSVKEAESNYKQALKMVNDMPLFALI